MTIILTGAGSGGHITPLLAVASELRKLDPALKIVYIGHRGDSLSDVASSNPNIDHVYTIRAGKFRRYYGEGLKQVLDVSTMLKNVRDAWWTLVGLLQSKHLLKGLKPDMVFIKGSLLGVPVGLAAAYLHVPYITHDSDAVPGLANRIIARWATAHAVALPKDVYSYPEQKTYTVGVPVSLEFKIVNDTLRNQYKKELTIERFKKVLFVTGGGLGAQRLNQAVVTIVPDILNEHEDLLIIHIAGRKHEEQLLHDYRSKLSGQDMHRVIIKGFVKDLYRYSGAADVIISRAGATNIAEFSIQAKACIVIPNPNLVGGHQSKNAELLNHDNAIRLLTEQQLSGNLDILKSTVSELLNSEEIRQELGRNLHRFAHPQAAGDLAELLLSTMGDVNSPSKQ